MAIRPVDPHFVACGLSCPVGDRGNMLTTCPVSLREYELIAVEAVSTFRLQAQHYNTDAMPQ